MSGKRCQLLISTRSGGEKIADRDAVKFITASDNAHSMPDASPVAEIDLLVATREGHVLLTTRSILTTTLWSVTMRGSNSATRGESIRSNMRPRNRTSTTGTASDSSS